MATITLKYNAQNTVAKKAIDLVLSLGVFKVQSNSKSEIEHSLDDLKQGKYFAAKSGKDVISKCL